MPARLLLLEALPPEILEHAFSFLAAKCTPGQGLDPKTDFCIVHVTFSAQGFGHYYLSGKLTTFDWKSWRFHGDLAFRTTDTEGRLLAEITHVSDIL